jgi:hypothetical protein
MARKMLALSIALGTLLAGGCGDKAGGGGDDTGGGGEGDGGGGEGGGSGGGDTWRPSGLGTAYFADGSEDGSLFHLEMQAVPDPREGEAYYGWILNADGESIALGEIPVSGPDVTFEADVGLNALLAGYNRFEAYAGSGDDANVSGEALWVGTVDPTLQDAYQQMLLSTEEVPGQEGSARAIQTTIEAAMALAQDTLDNTTDLVQLKNRGERISNALSGEEEDLLVDGSANSIDDVHPILGEGGGADLVLRDLDQASASVGPGHPVKDLANWSYDCTEEVARHADDAAAQAAIATAVASVDQGKQRMQNVIESLQYAIDGEDQNEDGSVDPIDEGALTCALGFINQMAFIEVTIPGAVEE